MTEPTTTRKPGRPPAAGEPRTETIKIRATPAEAEGFDALGGPAWFRRTLKAALARLRRKEGQPPA
jgi:hypothetical protein